MRTLIRCFQYVAKTRGTLMVTWSEGTAAQSAPSPAGADECIPSAPDRRSALPGRNDHPPSRRTTTNSWIKSIETDDHDSDRRAWHRSEATVGADATVAVEMERVAARAAARGAYSVAATAAERAAGRCVSQDLRAALLRSAGTWSWYAGEAERATALLVRSDLVERSPALSSRGRRLQGMIAARSGGVDEARDLLLRAGDDSPDPSEAIACYAETIDVCFYLADAATALLAAGRVEALLSRATPAAVVRGLLAVGIAKVLAGRDGTEQLAEAVRRAEAMTVVATGPQWNDGTGHPSPDDMSWLVLGPIFLRDSSSGRALVQTAVDDQRGRSASGRCPTCCSTSPGQGHR